jgi:hypothetical protein
MKVVLFLAMCVTIPVSAQDWQTRDAAHVQADVNQHWFLAGWSVTNLRTQTLNNTNLFGGAGYRGKDWWLEAMAQHQWTKTNQWALDFRFNRQTGRWRLYAEVSPFLTKKAFYEYVIVERRTWKGFSFGAETENTHQPGPDTIAAGPRVSHKLGRFAGFDASAAVAVRFSPVGGHTEPRLYLVFNRRLYLRDRK